MSDTEPPPRWYGGSPTTDASSGSAPVSGQQGVSGGDNTSDHRRDWAGELAATRAEAGRADGSRLSEPAEEKQDAGSVRDSARTVGTTWFGRDLVGPGPGLLPIGRKARERRNRRREIAAETRRRRDALRQQFAVEPAGPIPPRDTWREVDPRTHRKVIAGLGAFVVVVAGAAVWFSSRGGSPGLAAQPDVVPVSIPASTGEPRSVLPPAPSVAPSSPAGGIPPRHPIPSGGVAPITPPEGTAVDPDSVSVVAGPAGPPSPDELATPEAAVTAWLGRWCAFDYTAPFGAAERRAQATMTSGGWVWFDPADDSKARDSWAKTVAAKETGRCAAPQAQVSPEAPRTADSAIVLAAVNRVITAEGAATYVEQLFETRIVLRGQDGLWRVDLPTTGG